MVMYASEVERKKKKKIPEIKELTTTYNYVTETLKVWPVKSPFLQDIIR